MRNYPLFVLLTVFIITGCGTDYGKYSTADENESVIISDVTDTDTDIDIDIDIEDIKYTLKDNSISVYSQKMDPSNYKLEQLDDAFFNSLTKAQRYKVADKLLSSLFFAYPKNILDEKIDSNSFISDIRNNLKEVRQDVEEIEDIIHDNEKYYIYNTYPQQIILSRFFEFNKLDKHFFNHYMSYMLTQTILFSPATELNTVSSPDIYSVYNNLYNLISNDVSMRYITFAHMQSLSNWRRFRSSEDNGREMLEIYLLDAKDSHVPIAAKSLQNWRLDKRGNTLVVGLNKNTEALTMNDMKFKSGVDFYSSLVRSDKYIPGVTTRIVKFMFGNKFKGKNEVIAKIVSSNPESFDDIFKQVLFSKAYLMQLNRVKSIEEVVFPIMKKTSYNSYYYTFSKIKERMQRMGQASMSYKLGKLKRVPLDNNSFAEYQSAIRNNLFSGYSYDMQSALNPKDEKLESSEYYMSDHKSSRRRGMSAKDFMLNDGAYVVDKNDSMATSINYINYLFESILYRKATKPELEVFTSHIKGQTWENYINYTHSDPEYKKYVQFSSRYYLRLLVFEYFLRLDNFYFFKEIK